MREYNIALIGKGIVGTCFLNLLNQKINEISLKYEQKIKVVAIFEKDGALIREEGINIEEIANKNHDIKSREFWKYNLKAIEKIGELNLDLIVETTPTNMKTGEPAFSHIMKALENGIDVITSNKAPFYLFPDKIKNQAIKSNCIVRKEATVASCVPCIAMKEILMSNEIISIRAILNGTSNYILSRMTSEGLSFDMALKEAKEYGYAESDSTLDIDGYDAAGKLVILANELMGLSKTINDVKIRGISRITPQAIELARNDGFVIKPLAIIEENELIVEPRLIKKESPLNIHGTLNIIELKTKNAGPIILMGRGAGGYEAASALMNDLYYILKERNKTNVN